MNISPSVDWGQTSVSARYLAEYSGSLCPCCDVTCDRVMSGSVTLIGHTPTVTIHNRHPPPLCVSHDYCFHLIKYYNHNPFPIGPRHLAFNQWFSSCPTHSGTRPWVLVVSVGGGHNKCRYVDGGGAAHENGQVLGKDECLMMPHSHQGHHSLCHPLHIYRIHCNVQLWQGNFQRHKKQACLLWVVKYRSS